MRFIFNFFFFGILFYIIYLFFPEAFNTLVSWADHVFNFFRDIVHNIMEKTGSGSSKSIDVSSETGAAAFLVSLFLRK